MKKKTLNKIIEWTKDYELATNQDYGDEDTLDGSAYILFNQILKENK